MLFIIIEDKHRGKQPKVTRISQLTLKDAVVDRCVPDAGIDSELKIRCDNRRSVKDRSIQRTAAEFTFSCDSGYVRSKPSKLLKFGLAFSAAEFGFLMLGCIVSFGVSIFAIKFLMGYIKQHDFKVFDITVLRLEY